MSTVTWYRVPREARRRWFEWARLSLAIGIIGAAVLAAVAAADWTQTAYRRFLDRTNAFDVLVVNGTTTPTNANRQFDFERIARRPEVVASSRLRTWLPVGRTADGRSITTDDVIPIGVESGGFGQTLNEGRLTAGRLPVAADEVALTLAAADSLKIRVGDTIALALLGVDQLQSSTTPTQAPFRVVGVVAMQNGFPPITGGAPPFLLLSDALTRSRADGIELLAVRLRGEEDKIPAFEQALVAAAGGEQVQVMARPDLAKSVQRPLDADAASLRILALLMGAVALVLAGQGFAQLARSDGEALGVLRMLGGGRRELLGAGLVRTAVVTAIGMALAIGGAVALSPLSPVGIARGAEVDPGARVGTPLLVAALGLTLVLLAIGAVTVAFGVRVLSGRRRRRGRDAITSRYAAALGAPATAAAGIGVAAAPGEGGHALRWSLLPVVVGIATISGTLVFSASLARVFAEPALYGWSWDLQIGDPFSPPLEAEAHRLAADPALAAVAPATTLRLDAGALTIDAIAIGALRGDVRPTVVRGRAPIRDDEVLLGARTSKTVDAGIGQQLELRSGDTTRSFTVVGIGVLPDFSGVRLGDGAAMTLDGARRLSPAAEADVILVRVVPGPGAAAVVDRLADEASANVYRPSKPPDLAALERLGGLPSLSAILLGFMAAVMTAQSFLALVRGHRRDLAVLKVVGFRPRDVTTTVAWQVNGTAATVLLAGLTAGLLAGRAAWGAFARQLGVPVQVVAPRIGLIAVVAGTLAVVNVIAVVPAAIARRTHPAVELRTT